MKKVKKQSDRDYIGNRQKDHDWDAISKSVSQKGNFHFFEKLKTFIY